MSIVTYVQDKIQSRLMFRYTIGHRHNSVCERYFLVEKVAREIGEDRPIGASHKTQ